MTDSSTDAKATPAEETQAGRPKHLPLIGTQSTSSPLIVRARMLNEVMYCDRLVCLEWVNSEFADNHFTARASSRCGLREAGSATSLDVAAVSG